MHSLGLQQCSYLLPPEHCRSRGRGPDADMTGGHQHLLVLTLLSSAPLRPSPSLSAPLCPPLLPSAPICPSTPPSPWQVFADPEAADQVLTSGANIHVLGLNVTTQVTLTAFLMPLPHLHASLTPLLPVPYDLLFCSFIRNTPPFLLTPSACPFCSLLLLLHPNRPSLPSHPFCPPGTHLASLCTQDTAAPPAAGESEHGTASSAAAASVEADKSESESQYGASSSPAASLVACLVNAYRAHQQQSDHMDGVWVVVGCGIFLHDACAVAAIIAPSLFSFKRGSVRVECTGVGRGCTLMDYSLKK
ncbi:unnamed protein product [Closterium sp. Naga37s-1]|nr:unnamed protein product [Closterium sp. Naga37s-1]